MDELPKKRGGRREGAGRKRKCGEATVVKRIPISQYLPLMPWLLLLNYLKVGLCLSIEQH